MSKSKKKCENKKLFLNAFIFVPMELIMCMIYLTKNNRLID